MGTDLGIRYVGRIILALYTINLTLADCHKKIINLADIRQNYKDLTDPLSGPIYQRGLQIQAELKRGEKKPFTSVMSMSIGDPKVEGLEPMTFVRQVIAAATYSGLNTSSDSIPDDVFKTAQMINEDAAGGVGSYSDPEGLDMIRKNVAKFIEQRDGGIESKYEDIYLSDGVFDAMATIMKLLQFECNETRSGIMVPVPTYPLYYSMLSKYDFQQINYYLNEANDWDLEISELERAYDNALVNCNCRPRAILIVNPGNPVTSLLTREKIELIVKFAHGKKLLLLTDEIYQHNVYGNGIQFESLKKTTMEMGAPYNRMELISCHSISKGYVAEPGFRGGYFEFVNMDPAIKNVLFQLLSQKQCANRLGQVGLNCLADPPTIGEPSYRTFTKEKTEIIRTYSKVVVKMRSEFNKLQGYNCSSIDAGLFAFPKVNLPPKAIKAAEAKGQYPDMFYGLELLESTGIVLVVGSAFELPPNQTYIRVILPSSMAKVDEFFKRLGPFHSNFMEKYA